MNSDASGDKSNLIPLVRSRFYHEAMKLRVATQAPEHLADFTKQYAFETIASHLAVSIAVDNPQHYHHLTHEELESRGLTFHAALEIAKRNLARDRNRMPEGVRLEFVDEGFWCPSGSLADHNASLILYTETFRQLRTAGDPILFIPHPDVFWVTGSTQSDVVALLCGMSLQEIKQRRDRPITPLPFILVGDDWKPWEPSVSHPMYGAVRELHAVHESIVYDAQRDLLRRRHEAAGRDLHVAAYQQYGGSAPPGSVNPLSMSVWTETVPSLLPKTDVVQLQRLLNREALDRGEATQPEFGEVIAVAWESLGELAGAQPQPQNLYPERYLAERFPNEATWQALRKRSSSPLARGRTAATKTLLGPTPAKLIALGCALGFGSLVAVALIITLLLTMMNRGEVVREFKIGKSNVLMPSSGTAAPRAEDFESGEIARQSVVPDPFATLRELPPFEELPEPPLTPLGVFESSTEETGFAGHPRGEVIQDRPPPGGVLVGLRLTKGTNWGGAIRSIQPIYQVGERYQLGGRCGPPRGVDQIEYLARPGFVVHTIRVQAGLALNALQIEFRSTDSGDEPPQTYSTKWFGCRGGGSYALSDGPFVGVDVCTRDEVVSLQLVRSSRSPHPSANQSQ